MTPSGAGRSRRDAWKLVGRATARSVLSLTALFSAYYLVPAREVGSDVPWLLVVLGLFGVVVGIQIPIITRADFPVIRAVEALTLALPVFLLIFARAYLSASLHDPSSFSEALNRTDALYFTVSCFATVGFGDIVATSEPMRLLVVVQIILDLVLLGAVVRLFASAARRGLTDREREGRKG